MVRAEKLSFGGTAAIVTSMGVISGLTVSSPQSKAVVIASLLVIALADNLTDSLAIHIYQESEKLDAGSAFRSTVTNFFVRLMVMLSFVGLVALLPANFVVPIGLSWGMLLLAGLSTLVARNRGLSISVEVGKHLLVAITVIAVSKLIGKLILAQVE